MAKMQGTYALGTTNSSVVNKDSTGSFGIPRTITVGSVYQTPGVGMPYSAQIRQFDPIKYVPAPRFPTQWSGTNIR